MLQEDLRGNVTSDGDDAKTPKRKNLLWSYLMSLLLMFIGFSWRYEIKTKGYYIDGKHQMAIHGDEGLVTVSALIAGGSLMLVYSLIKTLRIKKKK